MNEDSAWGPGMMFGVTGPGPKRDRKPIPSDPKKEKGINIKTMKKMKNLKSYDEFLNEEKEIMVYEDFASNFATKMLSNPLIRRNIGGVVTDITGKTAKNAMSMVDKAIGIESDYDENDPNYYGEFDMNDVLGSKEEAEELVRTYIAATTAGEVGIEPEEKPSIFKRIKNKVGEVYDKIFKKDEEEN
jgi:hypothetical protein